MSARPPSRRWTWRCTRDSEGDERVVNVDLNENPLDEEHASSSGWALHCKRDSEDDRRALNVDLNENPSVEERMPEEAAAFAVPSSANQEAPASVDPQHVQSILQGQLVEYLRPANEGDYNSPIDVDAIKDEVEMWPSVGDIPQPRGQLRRSRPEIVDVEENSERNLEQAEDLELNIGLSTHGCNKRIKITDTTCSKPGNLELNLVDFINDKTSSLTEPKEITFDCPVCLHTIADACSTICGHIFCEKCIKETVKKLKRCPTCRRKLTKSNYHRVYFPSG